MSSLNLQSLRRFEDEHAKVALRLGAAANILETGLNQPAQEAIIRAEKINRVIAPIARITRKGGKVNNWTGVHVPFLHNFYDTLLALELGKSLSTCRGDGRLSALVDNVRPMGNGFRVSVGSILKFNGLDQMDELKDLEFVRVDKGLLHASFPVANMIHKSGPLFTRMLDKLSMREAIIAHSKRTGERIDPGTREFYLIKNNWTSHRILEESVEFATRSMAYGVPANVRERLVYESIEDTGLNDCLKSLTPRLFGA